MRVFAWLWCLLFGLGLLAAAHAEPVIGLKAADRIIFVGDSITGQGARYKQGFVNLFHEGLLAVHPDWTNTLLPLGGSGQSVASWAGVEKRSRDTECLLDVPAFGVKATLDQPADVVIILLGMNDILSPYVSEQPDALDRWSETYIGLVAALRARVHPRIIALATITMNTDDLKSPKNILRAALNTRISEIARTQHCVVLSTGQEMEMVLKQGRVLLPDFHPANDFVHPNTFGHAAIAAAMLQGFTLWMVGILVAYALGFALPLGALMLGVSFATASVKFKGAEVVVRGVAGVALGGVGFYFVWTF